MSSVRAARERGQRLSELSSMQRSDLAAALAPWQAPLATLDQALGVVRRVQRRPVFAVGAVLAAVVIIRPRRVLRWLRRGGAAWLAARLLRQPH